jgi:alpha-L-fucosidase
MQSIRELLVTAICACFIYSPALSSDVSTESQYPAWYQPPQLFVMTGFIANTTSGTWGPDFIISGLWTHEKQQAALASWNKGLGSRYDADKTLLAFKEAGATGVIFYDKWHDGIVPHDTRLTNFKTERDLVGETVKAARKHGLKIVIYYSVGFDYNPDPKFQDWLCRDANGQPMGGPFPADRMSFHSPYGQYVIDHLVEITKNYGPLDGLWLDIFDQPLISYDRHTKAAFEKRYGKPIDRATLPEQGDFVVETLRQFLTDIKQSVRAVQPNISFTFNAAGMADLRFPKHANRVDSLADFFSMEGHQWLNIDRGARTGHAMNRPFEVGMLLNSSWYVPMTDQAPPPAMSADETVVSAATAWIQGANAYGAMAPGHSGIFDENGDLKMLRAAGDWLKENREGLIGSIPYADIGTVTGNPSPELLAVPDAADFWAWGPKWSGGGLDSFNEETRPGYALDLALRKVGYFTESIGTAFPSRKFDFAAYRMLLLPENALFDSGLAGEIREYVRNGGALLAFGHASLLDEMARPRNNFVLNDVFGADFVGNLPGYKQFAASSEIASSLPLNLPALAVKPTTGKVLGTWASAGDAPAIIENRFGKGRVIYVSAAETAFGKASAMLTELAGRLIGPPPIAVESTREYAMVASQKGNDLLVYLLNRSTGSRANTDTEQPKGSAFEGPEEVTLRIDTSVVGEILGAELVSPKAPARMSRMGRIVLITFPASPSVTTLNLRRQSP